MATVALLGTAAVICIVVRNPHRGVVRQEQDRLHHRASGAGLHADDAGLRLSDTGDRFLRHRQAPRHRCNPRLRDAAGHPPHGAGPERRAPLRQGGCDRFRGLEGLSAVQSRAAARHAFDHDRHQSDDSDVPLHGGHRLVDRRQGARGGRVGGRCSTQRKAQGWLRGWRFLLCAMVLDRIVQGRGAAQTIGKM